MIKLTRPVQDHLDYTNSNGVTLKCEYIDMYVEFKSSYEDEVMNPMLAILSYIANAKPSLLPVEITLNDLPCTIESDYSVTCGVDRYKRGGLNADWSVPVWYVCGTDQKGVVIMDTEDCNQYEVAAFELNDGYNNFIILHSGSVASCLQYVKGIK